MNMIHKRMVSPPLIMRTPTHVSNSQQGFLSELQHNAQESIQKKLKLKSFQSESSPPKLKQPVSTEKKKIVREHKRIIRTKKPSLPYIPAKDGSFYDKWYIPYDQRFIEKPQILKQKELSDEMHFYNHMSSINFQFDPFQPQMPDHIRNTIHYKQRTDALREMFKGSRIVHEFKKSLEKNQSRVPGCVQKIEEEKS